MKARRKPKTNGGTEPNRTDGMDPIVGKGLERKEWMEAMMKFGRKPKRNAERKPKRKRMRRKKRSVGKWPKRTGGTDPTRME